jgi:eukaryotic-like serine/threonine-protein kinase
VRPTIAISLIAAIGAVVAALLFSTFTAPQGASPTPEPLPVVPGELGVHLQQLDEAVTG